MATYADRAAIMTNGAFLNRVAVSVAKYAAFILGDVANQSRDKVDWAKAALQAPNSIANQIASLCIWDAAVTGLANGTTDATSLTDAQIQGLTESVVNTYALKWF
jgi:hypothetical protein